MQTTDEVMAFSRNGETRYHILDDQRAACGVHMAEGPADSVEAHRVEPWDRCWRKGMPGSLAFAHRGYRMSNPNAPAMPPVERLLALDTLTLWRVVLLALCDASYGAWRFTGGMWALGSHVETARRWIEENAVGDWVVHWLPPSPLSDHAAAWELAMREMCGWEFDRTAGRHAFLWPYGDWDGVAGPRKADPMRALALAVLDKHASGPLEPLITPLLERINKEGLDK